MSGACGANHSTLSDVEEAITRVHHDEWARVVAALTRRFGDLDIAEEAAAEAFATAATSGLDHAMKVSLIVVLAVTALSLPVVALMPRKAPSEPGH